MASNGTSSILGDTATGAGTGAMVGGPYGALIGGAIGLIGGIIGNAASSGDQNAQFNAAQQAAQTLISTGYPPNLAQQIILQQYKQAGVLTPVLEQQINQTVSHVANIQQDPSTRNAQMQALNQMMQMGSTGYTPQTRAAFDQMQAKMNGQIEAQKQQIMQNYAARQEAGSGNELAAALMASQAGAQQGALQSDQLAANASQNALAAMAQAGNLGGQIRNTDFNQALTKAQAADQMQQFNIQNQIAQQQRNVASRNYANQYNLNNAQALSNLNTQQANSEQLRELMAQQQMWEDNLQRNTAVANGYLGQATNYGNRANRTSSAITGAASNIGSAVNGYLNMPNGSGGNNNQSSSNSGGSVTPDIFGSSPFQGNGSSVDDSGLGTSDLPDFSNIA